MEILSLVAVDEAAGVRSISRKVGSRNMSRQWWGISLIREVGRLGLVLGLLMGGDRGRASGQAMIRNPTQPILVYQTQGHSGPVRALVFDKTSGQILTAGQDKVVQVWDPSGERPRLVRTLRPPIWRSLRGTLFAMSLQPGRDPGTEATLAVAGEGIQSSGGNISLFAFPGRSNLDSGDLIGQLNGYEREAIKPEDDERELRRKRLGAGHLNSVNALIHHPEGLYLISGGQDGTIRLWNTSRREQLAVMELKPWSPVKALAIDPKIPVKALAIDAGGKRLWSASADGVVRLWDLTDPTRPSLTAHSGGKLFKRDAQDLGDLELNCMGLTPDGSRLFVGTEAGLLWSIDAATLTQAVTLPLSGLRGPVEALAISPDGSRFATSTVRQVYNSAMNQSPPLTDCAIELRSSVTGEVQSVVHQSKNRIHCLAFSPDGRSLAFAGDDDQGLFLKSLDDRPPVRTRGMGSSLWDVGFLKDGTTLGISRQRPEAANSPLTQGFDLRAKEPLLVPRSDLLREVRSLDGWTVFALDRLSLQVQNGQLAYRIDLEKNRVRWWDFTFMPNPNRPADEPPVVAIATQTGLSVFAPTPVDPANPARIYRMTRELNGHTAGVLGVAPSPDGRWLASCSDDQTVRLWRTERWETNPLLGMKVAARADKTYVVESVDRLGFADAMGLKLGDVLKQLRLKIPGVDDPKYAGETWLPLDDSLMKFVQDCAPLSITFQLERDGRPLEALTTKRDSPVISLFLSEELEWVVWTPEGYYDTSIKGDRTFLGFHQNGSKAGGLDLAEDTRFFTIDRFEKELRKPKLFDALIATGDRLGSYEAIPPADTGEVVASKQTPAVRLSLPAHAMPVDGKPLVVDSPDLALKMGLETVGFASPVPGLKQIRLLVDTGVVDVTDFPQPAAPLAPGSRTSYPFKVKLKPGLQRVSAVVQNSGDVSRPAAIEVDYRPKPPTVPVKPERVHAPVFLVASAGTGVFQVESFRKIPKVEYDPRRRAQALHRPGRLPLFEGPGARPPGDDRGHARRPPRAPSKRSKRRGPISVSARGTPYFSPWRRTSSRLTNIARSSCLTTLRKAGWLRPRCRRRK